MKKIAVVMFDAGHIGGVLPYNLDLTYGLREAGYEADLIFAVPKEQPDKAHGAKAGLGLRIHISKSGGRLFSENAIPYIGKKNSGELKEKLQEYDGVVLSKVPSWKRGHNDDQDWLKALQHGKPMVCIVHDTLWLRSYPWILSLRDKITYYVAVHPAAFSMAKLIPGRICCIVNPFDISKSQKTYEKDWNALASTAFFRQWKHNEDGIRAVPYMKPVHLFQTGAGIELSYMRAELKSKDKYSGSSYANYRKKIMQYRWKKSDYSYREKWDGKRIFDVAKKTGRFHYMGVVPPEELYNLKAGCGGSVDWSYHSWGEYFNRVTVEAMIYHCLPFARPTGIAGNETGEGLVFGPENVVLIREGLSPKKTGELIVSSMHDKALRKEMITRNLKKIEMFDRKVVAEQIVRALKGKEKVGLLETMTGKSNKKVRSYMEDFGE